MARVLQWWRLDSNPRLMSRTGHVANHTTRDKSYRPTKECPGSCTERHVVYPLPSVSRSRQENHGGDDRRGKNIFMIEPPHCGRAATKSIRRAQPLNVEVAKEFRAN